jgi:aldehyde:ferredoxin oxidoreductase
LVAGCGSNLSIFDPFFILEMNFYCDTYRLDTISIGTGIAFVMESFEMGLIDKYADFFTAVTGRKSTPEDLIAMSETVYNFQRVFNLKMGYGTREHDSIPYRPMGPVTIDEYESRIERYDKDLVENHKIDIAKTPVVAARGVPMVNPRGMWALKRINQNLKSIDILLHLSYCN